MKIVHIVPGFGGTFYCGNCLRDSSFVSALRQTGHQAVILPVYLPLSMNGGPEQPDTPVFYGAVNIYLKQQFPLMHRMPHWMEQLLNSKPVLNLAARKSGSTRAHGLEELTESMLLGKEGLQGEELQQLADYLKNHEKPDVVHLSNALLLGMAAGIKEIAGVPVVCSLQDEDVWVDAMDPEKQDNMWRLMSEKGKDADAFIAVSRYFASFMQMKMDIPDEKMHVVPIGVDPGKYSVHPATDGPPAIGYLSRICADNGFGIVVDAFINLKRDNRFSELRLHVTGGMTGDDRQFFQEQMKKVGKHGLSGSVRLFNEFDPVSLEKFFRSVTLLSVPVLRGEAFGLYQIEAMASGVPLVQPALGAFPEIAEATGGSFIYHPNTAGALTEALSGILSDPDRLQQMRTAGRQAVEEKFNSQLLAWQMLGIYQQILHDRIFRQPR